ncbi:MAG: hypothetical protein CM1200mP2_08020 [Planctomycetaceae bacterium]|nr:MAG: hypothetical protein CM1200mP2_08020 [Planctomycetaceae bacterium]
MSGGQQRDPRRSRRGARGPTSSCDFGHQHGKVPTGLGAISLHESLRRKIIAYHRRWGLFLQKWRTRPLGIHRLVSTFPGGGRQDNRFDRTEPNDRGRLSIRWNPKPVQPLELASLSHEEFRAGVVMNGDVPEPDVAVPESSDAVSPRSLVRGARILEMWTVALPDGVWGSKPVGCCWYCCWLAGSQLGPVPAMAGARGDGPREVHHSVMSGRRRSWRWCQSPE